VIPFFADIQLLQHVDWAWSGHAEQLIVLAPLLMTVIEQKKYVPSYSAHQSGQLQWTWDEDALDPHDQILLNRTAADNTEFINRLHAAFSATVIHNDYGTELAVADLRSEFPLLFQQDRGSVAGFDAKEWLVAIGWKADTAPFRPALQLFEPDVAEPNWRLQLVLQDKLDAATIAHVRLAADGTAFGIWPSEWSTCVQERSASWLERLRASLPARLFAADSSDILIDALDDEAAWRFLTADSHHLLELGWQVLLPAWWEAASRKKPRLRARVNSSVGSRTDRALFGLDSLIDYDWRIAIGETDLSEAEFTELIARNERLVRFRGQWIHLDPALLTQIRQAMGRVDKGQGLSFQDVLQLHLLGGNDASESESSSGAPEHQSVASGRIQLEVELNEHLIQLIGQLGQQSEWPKIAVPAGLNAELRAYQQTGYAWLAFLRRFGLGACLADDMGLGKTVQFIAYLLHIKENTKEETDSTIPSLLICPTSVLGNWQKELSRFAPSLNIMLHYGSRRLSGEAFTETAKQADLVLTSYATSALDQETLQTITWTSLCLDEAQNIKNAQAKQSSVVRSLPARHRIALTGTPIENRLSELWSIYDFINPGYLGTARAFNHRFSNAIEKEHDEQRTAEFAEAGQAIHAPPQEEGPCHTARLTGKERNENLYSSHS
jgi:hypothetical protein